VTRCYHYALTEGACDRCGAQVTVNPGHAVRLYLFGADGPAAVWVGGSESPSVVESLALVLGVTTDAVQIVDVAPEGEYYQRRLRVVWTLRGSRVLVTSRLEVSDEERHVPESTELDDEGHPVVTAEA
jgi:hypothetical protein